MSKKKQKIVWCSVVALVTLLILAIVFYANNSKSERINILCIGVDKQVGMSERDPLTNSIGQADAIFLVSVDTKSAEMDIVAIPRDTMVNIEKYNSNMQYMGTVPGQLCIQYAYADGTTSSCELTVDRVEELFSGITIDAYVAININAIMEINDAFGGVDVLVDDAYTAFQMSVWQGTTVHLMGIDAMNYLRVRDCTEGESAYSRIERIKRYVNAFIPKAKEMIKSNPGMIVELYHTLGNHLVTNLQVDDIVTLANTITTFSFENIKFHTLEGEIVVGASGYEEFYPNAEQMAELIETLAE